MTTTKSKTQTGREEKESDVPNDKSLIRRGSKERETLHRFK